LNIKEANMIFRTVCAWCGAVLSEKEYPDTPNYQALAIDGIIISHGICPKCKVIVETEYKLNGGNRKCGIG
jgi:hypothetical protein